MSSITLMEQEAAQASSIVARQLRENQEVCKALARRLQDTEVPFILTVARGSSDHAANFAKYILETQLNLVTALAAPSVTTLYNSRLKLKDALVIGLSQSGQSPDICEVMQMASVLPLLAGPEHAVAATKSFIATLSAILHFVASYKQDRALLEALNELPNCLEQTQHCNWNAVSQILQNVDSSLCIGRGYGYPIAQEVALKFKETCSINASAFSGAEVMHGPLALVKANYPVMLFAQQDASLNSVLELTEKLTEIGGQTILALPEGAMKPKQCSHIVTFPASSHPIMEPIIAVQAAYPMIARLAKMRGFDPDKPKNLKKVTKTL
ncbi:MAG: iron dicitrate transport regulator FecR [Gammaproteobacteria bacterium]|nr:iron dicitrate transport regulator FecR [Gammaproteobacteria bacterium]